MSDKIRIVNKTGFPEDTKVYIGKKQIPLTHMFKVGLVYEPDEVPVVHLELYAESVDVLGHGIRAIEKIMNESKEYSNEKIK